MHPEDDVQHHVGSDEEEGGGVVEVISENSRVRTPLLVNLGLKFALIVWLACLFTIAFARLFVRGSPVSLVDALL